jgi:hypothetical protein
VVGGMMLKKLISIFLMCGLLLVLTGKIYAGEPGITQKNSRKVRSIPSSFLMREQKLLVKNFQPVYQKLLYNPRASFTKKHLALIYARTLLSNLSQTADYSEEYNGYRYYKKVLPSNFLDERPKNKELFGIVERLIERKLLSFEKDGKFHPEKKLTRGAAFYYFIRLLSLTDLEGVKLPSIYAAAVQLNQHLSRIKDISGDKNYIPGFIRMGEYYNLLPPFNSQDIFEKEKDFFHSFLKGRDFYLNTSSGEYFGIRQRANLGFITYLLADNFVKWDIAAYLPHKGKSLGNESRDYKNKTLNANTLADAYITGFDVKNSLLRIKAKKISSPVEEDYTFYLPEDAYIWVVDKGLAYQVKGKKKLQKLAEVLTKFNTAKMFRFSINGLFKVYPMKLRNNIVLQKVITPAGKERKIPVLGYVEVILNRFDYTGTIEGVKGELVSVKLDKGEIRNFTKDENTIVKTRIYSDRPWLLGSIYDQLLKAENFNYWKKGISVNFKVDNSGKITYLLVPLFKIGKIAGVDWERLAIRTDSSLNRVYYLSASFSQIPLYIVSKREKGYVRQTNFSSVLGMDGGILPLQLYVQPSSVGKFYLNKKARIPRLKKISLGIGIE